MVTPAQKRDIAALAGYIADLLTGNSDLPAPQYFSVSQHGQEVSFQFGDTRDSFRALAQWAERFGGTVTGEPHAYDGWQSIHCTVKFTDHGVNVVAYAFIRVAKAAPADLTHWCRAWRALTLQPGQPHQAHPEAHSRNEVSGVFHATNPTAAGHV